jgi:hypothetical protein
MLGLSAHMSAWDGPEGRGFEGRVLALKLMDQAQASFWSSWNSGWIDDGLAKAAFVSLVACGSALERNSENGLLTSLSCLVPLRLV